MRGRYCMTLMRSILGATEQDTTAPQSIADILRARGIPVTAEGMARAGERLRAADERRDHAGRAALLARLRTGVSTA